jgi:hypothetical protein
MKNLKKKLIIEKRVIVEILQYKLKDIKIMSRIISNYYHNSYIVYLWN